MRGIAKAAFSFGLMAFGSSAFASSRASLKATEIVLERCSRQNSNKCQFKVNSSILKSFQVGSHQKDLVIFLGERQVFTSSSFRLVAKEQEDGNTKIRLISSGVWELSESDRRELQNRSLVALVAQRKRVKTLVSAPDVVKAEKKFQPKSYRVEMVSAPEPKQVEVVNQVSPGPSVQDPTVSREPEESDKLAMNSRENNVSDRTSTFDSFENWALGKSNKDHPVVNIRYKLGSPHSPSSYQGGQVDFFLRPIFSLGVAGGSYTSSSFLRKEAGTIKYNVTSATSQLKIGSKGGAIALGLALSQIEASFKSGSGLIVDGKEQKILPASDTVTNGKESYLGLSPSLGLRFESDSFYLMTFDYGTFIPLQGNYEKDKKPVFKMGGKADKVSSARTNWFSLGFGVGF